MDENALKSNYIAFDATGARDLSLHWRLQVARVEIQKACKKGKNEATLDFELDAPHCRTLEGEGYEIQLEDDVTTILWL